MGGETFMGVFFPWNVYSFSNLHARGQFDWHLEEKNERHYLSCNEERGIINKVSDFHTRDPGWKPYRSRYASCLLDHVIHPWGDRLFMQLVLVWPWASRRIRKQTGSHKNDFHVQNGRTKWRKIYQVCQFLLSNMELFNHISYITPLSVFSRADMGFDGRYKIWKIAILYSLWTFLYLCIYSHRVCFSDKTTQSLVP